jgi:hypothetical protein
MDNHQYELASAMEMRNYAICSEPRYMLLSLFYLIGINVINPVI